MKKLSYFSSIAISISLIIISCENLSIPKYTTAGQLTNHSDCKNGLKSTSLLTETPDSLSCVEYSFNEKKNILTLTHINAGFNCCPDSLYCFVGSVGDTIHIQEFESSNTCRCNCLYDINIDITGVESKTYLLQLIEPYAESQAELLFEINLNESTTGCICVTRKQYPWGVVSMN